MRREVSVRASLYRRIRGDRDQMVQLEERLLMGWCLVASVVQMWSPFAVEGDSEVLVWDMIAVGPEAVSMLGGV